MRGGFDAVGRGTVVVLLAAGMLLAPGRNTPEAVARSLDCPRWPVTINEIAKLTPEHAVACFADATLTFTAYVPPHPYGIGGTKDHDISPVWLDGLAGSFVMLSAGPHAGVLVPAFVPPALGRCDGSRSISACPFRLYWGRWASVSAHFDGPVAQTCRVTWHDPGVSFADADAVAECRSALIILSVGPIAPPATATLTTGLGTAGDEPTVWLGIAALALALLLLTSRAPSSRPSPAVSPMVAGNLKSQST